MDANLPANFYDVIIVGSGISGLIAADILLKEEERVLVLQASQYCGGLIYSAQIQEILAKVPGNHDWLLNNEQARNTFLELGAYQISTDHTYMLRLVDELDLTVYSSYSDGKFIYGKSPDNIIQSESLMDVYLTPQYKKTVLKLISKIENISKNIKEAHQNTINNPSRNYYQKVLKEYIEIYDKMTVQEFFKLEIDDQQLRKIVKNQFQTVQSISTDKISVLQVFLHEYGLQNLKLFVRENQYIYNNLRIKEGISSIITKLLLKIEKRAKKLNLTRNDVIKLGQPVSQIRNQINTEVEVITNKECYRCFKVIFTASMAKANLIKISKLSEAKKLIFENQLGGKVEKIYVIFESAFWRSKYSGQGVFSDQFPFNQIVDCSPSNLSCGVLMLTLCADRVQKWKQMFENFKDPETKQQEMQSYMRKFIANIFLKGDEEHPHLEKMVFYHWFPLKETDNFGYQTFTKSGICIELDNQGEDYFECYSRDQHNMMFLSSQLSKKFGSFMEGAIRQARDKVYRYLEMEDPWETK